MNWYILLGLDNGIAGRRKKTRYKSLYIGGETELRERGKGGYVYRPLAEHFSNLIREYGKITYHNKDKPNERSYYRRPSGDDNPIALLERRIIACIDLDSVEAIDHDALEQLQSEEIGRAHV